VISGHLVDWGVVEYAAARERQLGLLGARQRGEAPDTLIFLEHPHVITLGRARGSAANVVAAGDVPVVETERGGDVTYHGPGQIVGYPIVELGEGEKDLHRFLRNLEEGMIRALATFGVTAGRKAGATGVWVGEAKIASIGIACRRWITFHGLALNVATDLGYFRRINPCGFDAGVMTSLASLLGQPIAPSDVKPVLAREIGAALGREFVRPETAKGPRRQGRKRSGFLRVRIDAARENLSALALR
jgi:lipoate-protein ligase B